MDVIEPATGELLARSPAASAEDVNDACNAARRAFEQTWGKTTGRERAVVLRNIASGISARKDELSEKEAVNTGKPLKEAAWDVDDVSGCFEYYAGLAEELDERQYSKVDLPADYADSFNTSLCYEPVGVVGAIVPWNYPLLMAAWKVGALSELSLCALS